MNVNMYNNPVVQENLEKLRKRGFIIVEPAEGELACGWEGKGRLPEIPDIVYEMERTLAPKDFNNERVLVTAGATREFIDSVRYISNPASGKMGYALAKEGAIRGAEVVLVSGKTNLDPPKGVKLVNVVSAGDMYESVMEHFDWSTIVIKAAAVGDYTPSVRINTKIKKDDNEILLKLERTKDILKTIGEDKNGRIVVGFAAETENVLKNARDKLKGKNADMIVANDVSASGAGFEADTNIVQMVYGDGKSEEIPLSPKSEIAKKIFDKILEIKASTRRL
jgi:phosphopantothenoylcysteine decarboxylase/phosphopantothenate--cysteine ligase